MRLYLPVLLLLLFSELIRVCKGVPSESVGLGLYQSGALTPPRPLNSCHRYLPHLSKARRRLSGEDAAHLLALVGAKLMVTQATH